MMVPRILASDRSVGHAYHRETPARASAVVEHLSYILYGDRAERLALPMAMLTAYFDESRTDHGKPYPFVGGLIAPVENWLSLSVAWHEALGMHDIALEDFHTKALWNNEKPFDNRTKWTRGKKGSVVNDLIDVAVQHVSKKTDAATI